MNTTLILFVICFLIPTAAAITCYEGMVGSVQSITQGHESCRLLFDMTTDRVLAKGSRGSPIQFSNVGPEGVPRCEASHENQMVVCDCFTNNCNKPMHVIDLMQAGFRVVSQEVFPPF